MTPRRYLCSELVTARISDADRNVNLEEIWQNGAILESEGPAEHGAKAELRCATAIFAGRINRVERHEFGWHLEIEFSPLTPWSPDRFQPEHLLDPSKL